MMMMVDLENSDISIDELRKNMENQAIEMGVEINIMSERVFSAMHRV
jgi:ACT domain-containing protein